MSSCCRVVAGFHAGRLYKTLKGLKWKRAALMVGDFITFFYILHIVHCMTVPSPALNTWDRVRQHTMYTTLNTCSPYWVGLSYTACTVPDNGFSTYHQVGLPHLHGDVHNIMCCTMNAVSALLLDKLSIPCGYLWSWIPHELPPLGEKIVGCCKFH